MINMECGNVGCRILLHIYINKSIWTGQMGAWIQVSYDLFTVKCTMSKGIHQPIDTPRIFG